MKGKTPSVQSRLVGTILAAGLVLAVAASAHALSGSGMDLPVESDPRNHPGLNVYARDFNVYTGNVYTGASMPPGWTSMDTLSVDFTDHLMWGTMTSEVWKDTDGHLLFAYQIDNTGDEHPTNAVEMKTGNVAGFGPGWDFQDCGILDFRSRGDDPLALHQGDVLMLTRTGSGSTEQFGFSFEREVAANTPVTNWLLPGETSSWFYYETNARSWQLGQATVQDGGSSAYRIRVLVPAEGLGGFVPEPVTVAGLAFGVASLGGYLRRRRVG